MSIHSAGGDATVALTDDDVLRSLLGMAGYLTAIGLMGLGLGILLRSAASSIGVLIGASWCYRPSPAPCCRTAWTRS